MSGLIVELAGLPGAGKSTLTQALAAAWPESDGRLYIFSSIEQRPQGRRRGGWGSKLRTLATFLSAAARQPRVAGAALRYGLAVRPITPAGLRRTAVLLIRLAHVQALARQGYDLILLDQGLLQAVWSIGAAGQPPALPLLLRLVDALLEVCPLAAVYVEVEVAEALRRMAQRPSADSRFDNMAAARAGKLLQRQRHIFEQLFADEAIRRRLPHLTVDGHQPVAENVTPIRRFIRSKLGLFPARETAASLT